jgi:Domain of unknown function (DUF1963)
MTPEMLDRLNPFRDEALKRGIPSADVERWITATARPCATLSPDGDGPVVGQFGGSLALPAGVPDPFYPLLATIDCAAIPGEATDIPLPPDGRLLLFGYPDLDLPLWPGGGSVVYIPSGAAVEEREEDPQFREDPERQEIRDQYPQGQLRLTINVSLPYYGCMQLSEPPYQRPLPGHPHSEELCAVWMDTVDRIASGGPLQIGGYATDEYDGESDPLLSSAAENPEGWVLLADWYTAIEGREGATVHWGIRREDVAARRFDQARASVFWNP